MSSGRPSKIAKINLDKVKHYAAKGYTDDELKVIFGVTDRTLDNWKKKYPIFFRSLKEGKLIADEKVVASLFERACGYSHPEVDIRVINGEVVKIPIVKHYPPDTTAMIFWLKNRQRENWRDKQDINHTIIKETLYKENENKTNKELKEESLRLANTIVKNQQGAGVPEEA
jgi:hypothetical protein